MKRFAMAVVLVCALSSTILAGNMPTVGVYEPPPPPPSATQPSGVATVTGNMPTGGLYEPPPPPSGTQSNVLVAVVLTIVSLI